MWGREMKKSLVGKLLVLVLIVIAIGSFVKNELNQDLELTDGIHQEMDLTNGEVPLKGKPAPDFHLTTLDGEEVSLSDFKGQKVVLNFWATWCPPCKVEMPHFQEYEKKYTKKDNVVILALNMTYNDQGPDNVQKFVDSYDLTFRVPLMEDDSIMKQYKILSIPTTAFIDEDGNIQRQISGALDTKMLRTIVKDME